MLWLYELPIAQLLALAQASENTDIIKHRHLLPCSYTAAVYSSHFCLHVFTLQAPEFRQDPGVRTKPSLIQESLGISIAKICPVLTPL